MAQEFVGDEVELANTAHRRLNCGCGLFPLLYYTNLDSDPASPAEIRRDALEYLAECVEGDYDEIYAGHFLEHLEKPDALTFLAECYRVLSPGGKLGIVVPDTYEVCKRYVNQAVDAVEFPGDVWWNIAHLDSLCALFFYSTVQETRHKWSWDMHTLGQAMGGAGFVRLAQIDRYRDPRLGSPAWYQCGIDGHKPKGAQE
ncbi:MAG: methyltransferase domain-containing protein [Parcubacteria group bacterium]|jgi:SAM-dependent methyltransferase